PSEREEEFHVRSCLTVEGKLLFVVVAVAYFIVFQTERRQPVQAEALPVVEPLKVCIRLAEELKLHLLKLSCTERKVTRCDLVAEGFSDLSDTERKLLSGCTLYVLEVYEDSLRGLRTEIHCILRIFRYALECLEHQVELTDIREIVFSAGRARNLMLFDKCSHLLLRPSVNRAFQLDALLLTVILDKIICAVTLMTFFTFH